MLPSSDPEPRETGSRPDGSKATPGTLRNAVRPRLHRSNRLAYRLARNAQPTDESPPRVNGPPTLRRRLPVQRLPVAADARFPRGFQASAAWWGQPCAWNALATNAGSIPGLWSGVERSGVLHRFAFWPSRHHRREQALSAGANVVARVADGYGHDGRPALTSGPPCW